MYSHTQYYPLHTQSCLTMESTPDLAIHCDMIVLDLLARLVHKSRVFQCYGFPLGARINDLPIPK